MASRSAHADNFWRALRLMGSEAVDGLSLWGSLSELAKSYAPSASFLADFPDDAPIRCGNGVQPPPTTPEPQVQHEPPAPRVLLMLEELRGSLLSWKMIGRDCVYKILSRSQSRFDHDLHRIKTSRQIQPFYNGLYHDTMAIFHSQQQLFQFQMQKLRPEELSCPPGSCSDDVLTFIRMLLHDVDSLLRRSRRRSEELLDLCREHIRGLEVLESGAFESNPIQEGNHRLM